MVLQEDAEMEFEVRKVYWGIIAVKGKGGGLGRGKPTARDTDLAVCASSLWKC